MIVFIIVTLALTLLVWSFYFYAVSLRCDSLELRELDRVELHLAHIVRLLDAPDVRMLLEKESSRRDLLREFSPYLKTDVMRLAKNGHFHLKSIPLVGIFTLSYYLIRWKSRLVSGRKDLRFLSGIELALFRSLN